MSVSICIADPDGAIVRDPAAIVESAYGPVYSGFTGSVVITTFCHGSAAGSGTCVICQYPSRHPSYVPMLSSGDPSCPVSGVPVSRRNENPLTDDTVCHSSAVAEKYGSRRAVTFTPSMPWPFGNVTYPSIVVRIRQRVLLARTVLRLVPGHRKYSCDNAEISSARSVNGCGRHWYVYAPQITSIGCMIGQFAASFFVGTGTLVNTLSFVCDHPSPNTRPNARSSWYCICSCFSGSGPVHRPFRINTAC